MTLAPAQSPYVVARGDTWTLSVDYVAPISGLPIDLTGSAVTGELYLAHNPLPIVLSVSNGGLVVDATTGAMTFVAPPGTTLLAPVDPAPGAVPAGYSFPNRLHVLIQDTLGRLETKGILPILVYDARSVPIGAVSPSQVAVITAAGLQGPAGPVSGLLSKQAVAPIPGHRVVKAVVGGLAVASQDQVGDAGLVIGVSLSAATAAGQIVLFAQRGEVVEATWSWTAGPVFLGVGGALTQTPPVHGLLQQIGVATSPTSMIVAIHDPIVRP